MASDRRGVEEEVSTNSHVSGLQQTDSVRRDSEGRLNGLRSIPALGMPTSGWSVEEPGVRTQSK